MQIFGFIPTWMAMEEADSDVCCSFNEVESLGKLAARGCGYPWSVASEAGRAVRWMAEHDLPGALILKQLLEQVDQVALSAIKPRTSSDGNYTSWHAEGEGLCPVLSGLSLVDFSHVWYLKPQVDLYKVFSPGLILPFAAQSSRLHSADLTVSWNACKAVFKNGKLQLGENDQLRLSQETEVKQASAVSIQCGNLVENSADVLLRCERSIPFKPVERARINHALLQALTHYAARTHAPVTDSSRLMGAGAGVSDND